MDWMARMMMVSLWMDLDRHFHRGSKFFIAFQHSSLSHQKNILKKIKVKNNNERRRKTLWSLRHVFSAFLYIWHGKVVNIFLLTCSFVFVFYCLLWVKYLLFLWMNLFFSSRKVGQLLRTTFFKVPMIVTFF